MLDALYGALADDPLVKGIWLSGSRARGEDDAYSDVDLALDAPGWEPLRLGGLWLGGQRVALGNSTLFHGVLSDGTILDVLLASPGDGYRAIHAAPQSPPPATEAPAEGPALDFWINSMKHAKPLARGVSGMMHFGLLHDSMALMRLWALEDSGRDPGPGAFNIFALTLLVREHLTPERLRLLGIPKRDEAELRAAVNSYRDAATQAGEAAEARWGVRYPRLLDAVVRRRWPV